MAGLGDCSSQQHHRLRYRDAYGSIRVRSGQFVLHGTLRKQLMELAMQATINGNTKRSLAVPAALKLPVTLATIALLAVVVGGAVHANAQSAVMTKRTAKHLVTPTMPELGKRLNLSGTVRIEVTIAPDGNVKRTRIIGGHPVLAAEAERAAEKSTFEPGPAETTEVIEFRF